MSRKKNKNNVGADGVQNSNETQTTQAPQYTLDIPDDEVWTYHVEGLQPPFVGKPVKNAVVKKAVTVIVLIIAIALAIYMSVRAVHNEHWEYKELDVAGTFELDKYNNPGTETEVTIDYVGGDTSKPIVSLREYAFNCDEKLTKITIGKDVKKIDGKSFYSCYGLQQIIVDDENEYFCDVDGVLYNKDMTELICFPINYDEYLRTKNGYTLEDNILTNSDGKTLDLNSEGIEEDMFYKKYVEDVFTYTVPETVTKICKLSLNYSEMHNIYLPEGLKTIETMAFFRNTSLRCVFSYKGGEVYNSLPEGLEYIGSDAFSYDQAMSYMYIPASVTYIGHHAFWETCYKNDNEVVGVNAINVALNEDEFKDKCNTRDQWRPEYDFMLFRKKVDVNYSAERV